MRDIIVAGLLTGAMTTAPLAAAVDRAESVREAHLIALPECPVTPASATEAEWKDSTPEIAPALALVLAGAAGELVKQGMTAGGEALEQASKERGIVAEGTTGFLSMRINKQEAAQQPARATPQPMCLVLYVDGSDDERLSDFATDSMLKSKLEIAVAGGTPSPLFDPSDNGKATLEQLRAGGMTRRPALYIEARLIPVREGLILRPVLVYYRKPLKDARRRAAASELHLALATPGASDLGTTFATIRVALPRIAPNTVLDWTMLRGSTSIIMPPRPAAGFVADKVAEMNTAYALVGTRNAEVKVAERGLATATTKHRAAPSAASAAALETAKVALSDARLSQKTAVAAAAAYKSSSAGATNAKMRFVVIRDENAFGAALAKALKNQAEAVSKATTASLSPQPEWAATDTGYLRALTAVTAKQREYEAAIAESRSGDAVKLADELLLLKAALNEAAAAASKPIPYPHLL